MRHFTKKGTAYSFCLSDTNIDGIKVDPNWKKSLRLMFVHEKFNQLFQEQEAIQVEHDCKSLEGIS